MMFLIEEGNKTRYWALCVCLWIVCGCNPAPSTVPSDLDDAPMVYPEPEPTPMTVLEPELDVPSREIPEDWHWREDLDLRYQVAMPCTPEIEDRTQSEAVHFRTAICKVEGNRGFRGNFITSTEPFAQPSEAAQIAYLDEVAQAMMKGIGEGSGATVDLVLGATSNKAKSYSRAYEMTMAFDTPEGRVAIPMKMQGFIKGNRMALLILDEVQNEEDRQNYQRFINSFAWL